MSHCNHTLQTCYIVHQKDQLLRNFIHEKNHLIEMLSVEVLIQCCSAEGDTDGRGRIVRKEKIQMEKMAL